MIDFNENSRFLPAFDRRVEYKRKFSYQFVSNVLQKKTINNVYWQYYFAKNCTFKKI